MATFLLVLAACGNEAPARSGGPLVSPEKMPAGAGRGFPTVATVEEGGFPEVGELAPAFSLELEDGRTLTMASLRGRPVIINHWASWCGPCRVEMPVLVEAARTNPDLVIIAANRYEDPATVAEFALEYDMEFPVTVDPQGLLGDLYSIRALPTTIFIDRAGRIASVWTGMLDEERLAAHLARL